MVFNPQNMIHIVLTTQQKVAVTLNPIDATGAPKPITSPAWDNQGNPVEITLSNGDMTATLKSTTVGTHQVIARGNAGHSELESVIELEVVEPEAVDLNPIAAAPVVA